MSRRPNSWIARFRIELLLTFRDRRTVTFTVILPFVLLLTLSSLLHNQTIRGNVSFAQYLTAGMIASGLVYGGFQSLSIALPDERANGTLKRLHGSPMPPSAYFAGKVGGVVVTYALQMVLMLTLGAVAFHVHLPTGEGQIVRFLWLSVLGPSRSRRSASRSRRSPRPGRRPRRSRRRSSCSCSSPRACSSSYTKEPKWMRAIASVFPLRWLAQGMRSVFLPAAFGHGEVDGSFQLPRVALMLGIWSVIGVVLCWRTFRWLPLGED